MTCHDVTIQAASAVTCHERPGCPCCGDIVLLPVAAEFAGQGCVRHTWVCEGCGHAFQTAVRFRRKSVTARFSPDQ